MTKPKLLLDENIGISVSKKLRGAGYDVKSIIELSPGMDDHDVLNLAITEDRILVTLNKDFGNLVFYRSQKHVGVIFLRLHKESGERITTTLLSILASHSESIEGKFVTTTDFSIRIK